MNKSHQHTNPSQFALLLLAVFIGSLIAKPAHSLLAHHDIKIGISGNHHQLSLAKHSFKDCPVCDFEFCTFIPQKQINVPPIIEFIAKQLNSASISSFANTSSHLFQLRAPPAF